MKMQMCIMHVQTGLKWNGEYVEVTESELNEAKEAIKQHIGSLTYIELENDIIPADFIRNHCVIRFITEA